jgi:hypothetical protein
MRKLALLLACCIVALAVIVLMRTLREPRQRPVLVMEDGRNTGFQSIRETLAMCPGVALGFAPNVGGTSYYHLLLDWHENRWEGYLFQDAAEQEYAIWAGAGADYNALLRAACSRIGDDVVYRWPEASAPAAAETGRYDLHDLRNGNVATSAILDRKTGRVWVWTAITDSRGVKTKTEFTEEDLVPTPSK